MAERGRFLALSLFCVACLTGLAGCAGVARGPDPLVGGTPVAASLPPPATPRSFSLFAALDPLAARIDLRPADVVLQVRSEQVLIATVVDAEGRPLPGRRVEWLLEGPGAIVAVDDRGRLLASGGKIDSLHGVSFTEHFEHRVSRGASTADFTIGPGQSWCIVTSTEEGDTHVTAYAPEVANHDANKVVVTQHWADADWTAPSPSAAAPGSQQFLSANVFRHADHQPLAGYSVRYRILDGAPAVFLPSQTTETVVVTSSAGVAPIVVSETGTQTGRTRIGVEVLRKGDQIVGHGETHADWNGPDVSLSALFLPTAAVGQEAPLTLAVNNNGSSDAKLLTVRAVIPEGCKYVRSDPPAFQQGNELIWTLSGVSGRSRKMLQAVFQTGGAGTLTARASLTTADGRRDDKSAVCEVTAPRMADLKVWPSGPTTGLVGAPVVYQVTVRNQGTAPATNVVLKAAFDGGLEYGQGNDKVEMPVGTLAAGESRTVALPVNARRAGAAATHVTVVGDGNLAAQADRPLAVQDPRLTLRLSAPSHAYVGQATVWELEVRNAGDAPLSKVTIDDLLSPELVFVEASDGGRLQGREVVWSLGDLPANGQKLLRLTTTAPRPTPQATNTATATARVGDAMAEVRVQQSASVAVLGLPAYKMTVEVHDDPVEVGGRTAYRIQVKNTGSLPGERVGVTATVPAQMRVATAYGPTTYRVEGNKVVFAPLDSVPPGQTATYMVDVQAVQAGEARFRAELTTNTMREPVVKEESTNVR